MPFVFNVFTGNFDYYQSASGSVGALHSEIPATGNINGSNKVFTFTHAIGQLSLNDAVQDPNNDVTVSGSTATFINAPIANSSLLNWYIS